MPSESSSSSSNDYVIVAFTNVGTTTWTVPEYVTSLNVLVVGGGGSGGGYGYGGGPGGGGAGEVEWNNSYSVTSGETITVTVGAGGVCAGAPGMGDGGDNSVFSGLSGDIIANGGGGGGGPYEVAGGSTNGSGGDCGSGGGASGTYLNPVISGGVGDQGFDGGSTSLKYSSGAGGGGAGAVGANSALNVAGAGGAGVNYSSIFGTSYGVSGWFAGGGGGGRNSASSGGAGGQGGGGTGGKYNTTSATPGTPNTGSGGGGDPLRYGVAGDGGSGIVLIKYYENDEPTSYSSSSVSSQSSSSVSSESSPSSESSSSVSSSSVSSSSVSSSSVSSSSVSSSSVSSESSPSSESSSSVSSSSISSLSSVSSSSVSSSSVSSISSLSSSSSSNIYYTTIVPTLDAYHVCPTSIRSEHYQGYFIFDTSKSLVGTSYDNGWLSLAGEKTKQRINIDLGGSYLIRRMMYVNYHDRGGDENDGAQYFQIYGANSNIMFDAYDRGDNLTLLWDSKIERCTFNPSHPTAVFPALPVYNPVPIYVTIDNMTHYRFYALKMYNNWEGNFGIGLRRIELQEENGV